MRQWSWIRWCLYSCNVRWDHHCQGDPELWNFDCWTIRCYLRRKMGLCTLVALHWWRCNTAQNLTLPWQWCAWFAVMTKPMSWCEGVPPVLPKAWMMLWDITMSSDKAATGEDAEEQSLGGVSNLDLLCSFVSFDLFDRCTGPIGKILSKAVMHTTKSGTCDQMAPDEVGSIPKKHQYYDIL